MKFIRIEDKIEAYKNNGFEHGDHVIALLCDGEVKHGTIFFVEDYQTSFEVQLVVDQLSGRSEDLFEALVCKVVTE